MPELTVVIPTRNERGNLELLLPDLLAKFEESGIDGEIVIVDSASVDGTDTLVEQMATADSRVRLVCEPTVGNLALAWSKGVEAAVAPVVGFMDADRVHEPTDLVSLYRTLIDGPDMVIGNRYQTFGRKMESKSIFNESFSQAGQLLVRVWLGIDLQDISHGFRVFRKEKYERIRDMMKADGNSFLVEMVYFFLKEGMEIEEIPVGYGERIYGEDKLKVWRESKRFIKLLLRLRINNGRI
jgi:dolichol-phosphate mannosyltransferase